MLKLCLVALAVSVFACSQPTAPSSTATPTAPTAAAAVDSPLDRMLGAYESVRAMLAGDSVQGLETAAKRIAEAAAETKQKRPELASKLEPIAQHADKLSALRELEPARLQFGELSREVIALAAVAPEMKSGRHVFMCPMASGYQKWVQVTDKLQNPYFGSQMLECGAGATW